MLLIHGIYHLGKKRVACRNAYCTTCKDAQFFEGRKSLMIFHIFFIPLLPLWLVVRFFCTRCGEQLDSARPSRSWLLAVGAFIGLLIAFVGVFGLIMGDEIESEIVCVAFGLCLAGGLIWTIRRGNHKAYVSGKKSVNPLRGDICPYCNSSLFAKITPHCHVCKVDIITK
jgi:hypothetical protein